MAMTNGILVNMDEEIKKCFNSALDILTYRVLGQLLLPKGIENAKRIHLMYDMSISREQG